MELLTVADLSDILRINKTAIMELVNSNKIPYKLINTEYGDIIQFTPSEIRRWVPEANNLMATKEYVEKLKKEFEKKYRHELKSLKKFSDQFTDPREPKLFYIDKVPSVKLGFVYYVRYLDNGKVVPSHWCTHTNNKILAEKFAIENRERLLSAYYERKVVKKPSAELFSIFKNYYAENSQYLHTDALRGRIIGDRTRVTAHNAIQTYFVPYLKKERIKDIDQIDAPLMARFQNSLLDKGIKPQTINGYCSYISKVFSNLIVGGAVKVNPCASLPSLRKTSENQKIRGCYEINKIKGVFNKRWNNELSYLLCLTIYTTGMRNGEMDKIQIKDIISINNIPFIDIPKSKTTNGIRIVPLHDFVYKKLSAYIKKKSKKADDYLFTSEGKQPCSERYNAANTELAGFTGYTPEKLKAENITFYSGRHFWKTLMDSENLGDIEEYFMGHRVSSDVAKRYNHKDKQGRKKLLEKTRKVFAILDKWIFM